MEFAARDWRLVDWCGAERGNNLVECAMFIAAAPGSIPRDCLRSRSRSDYSLDFGKGARYVMYRLRRDAQLPRNLRQRKDAPNCQFAIGRSLNRFDHQSVVTTGKPQCSNHVAYSGPLDIVKVEDFQSIRWRHDVAYDNFAAANAAFPRKLYRSFAQNVRGSDDPEHLVSLVNDEQSTHPAGDHRLIGLVDRRIAVNAHGADSVIHGGPPWHATKSKVNCLISIAVGHHRSGEGVPDPCRSTLNQPR